MALSIRPDGTRTDVDLDNVHYLLENYIDYVFYNGPDPVVMEELGSLAKMIEERPAELVAMIRQMKSDIYDRFIDEGYCPHCGGYDTLTTVHNRQTGNETHCLRCGQIWF